jgi:PTH1 family peptidyl-tRNA hydrolase
MILAVGLGNPGKAYSRSKHNLGFMVVDEVASRIGATLSKKGFAALYGEAVHEEKKLLLLKPQTYMNRSGQSVSQAAEFFKITAEEIIVVYDEMDLPLGNLKIRLGGGSAGHKGIESIIGHLGDDNFVRVRLGIGKPGEKSKAVSHVLSQFTKEENSIIEGMVNRAADAVLEVIANGVESAMNKFNKKNDSPGPQLLDRANSK